MFRLQHAKSWSETAACHHPVLRKSQCNFVLDPGPERFPGPGIANESGLGLAAFVLHRAS
ncbi:MAG: hypothetical protein ACI841_002010 [Planctomycetota bacterium]|jgi:hypothetical protein